MAIRMNMMLSSFLLASIIIVTECRYRKDPHESMGENPCTFSNGDCISEQCDCRNLFMRRTRTCSVCHGIWWWRRCSHVVDNLQMVACEIPVPHCCRPSPWTQCSALCGNGVKTRFHTCVNRGDRYGRDTCYATHQMESVTCTVECVITSVTLTIPAIINSGTTPQLTCTVVSNPEATITYQLEGLDINPATFAPDFSDNGKTLTCTATLPDTSIFESDTATLVIYNLGEPVFNDPSTLTTCDSIDLDCTAPDSNPSAIISYTITRSGGTPTGIDDPSAFSPVSLDNDAVITCTATHVDSTDFPSTTADITLIVQSITSVTLSNPSQALAADVPIDLDCSAVTVPTGIETISYQLESDPIANLATFTPSVSDDSKVLTCTATIDGTCFSTATFTLVVHDCGTMVFTQPATVNEGDTISLDCTLPSTPEATLVIMITRTDSTTTTIANPSAFLVSNEDDGAEITCTATYSGVAACLSVDESVSLDVQYITSVDIMVQVPINSGTIAQPTCTVVSNPEAMITYQLDGLDIDPATFAPDISDNGKTLTCIATLPDASIVASDAEILEIYNLGEPDFNDPLVLTTCDTHALDCTAPFSNPPATISYTITRSGGTPMNINDPTAFSPESLDHDADITCTATHDDSTAFPSTTKDITLVVQSITSVTLSNPSQALAADVATALECSAVTVPTGIATFSYQLGNDPIIDSATFTPLTSDDSKILTCTATIDGSTCSSTDTFTLAVHDCGTMVFTQPETVNQGDTILFDCNLPSTPPAVLEITIRRTGSTATTINDPSAFQVSNADDGALIICSALYSGVAKCSSLVESVSLDVQYVPQLFINEFHYDNAGDDQGEFIELVGTAGLDLNGWSIILYNGANSIQYGTPIALSGVLTDDSNGYGFHVENFIANGIQNGIDGIALVQTVGSVSTAVEFISYEGSFTASGGPADTMSSTDIGVVETGSTPIGGSLQRTGTGSGKDDFTWLAGTETAGSINSGQIFT